MPIKANLYKVLGVDKNASDDDIKKAYRDKSKQYHPDSGSGDTEKFQEVKFASVVLLDPDKRARYDDTGDVEEGIDTTSSEALEMIIGMFYNAIGSTESPERFAIFETISGTVKSVMAEVGNKINDFNKKIQKYEGLRNRISKKSKGDNIFIRAIDNLIRQAKSNIRQLTKKQRECEIALEILSDYVFDQDMSEESIEKQLEFYVRTMRFQ